MFDDFGAFNFPVQRIGMAALTLDLKLRVVPGDGQTFIAFPGKGYGRLIFARGQHCHRKKFTRRRLLQPIGI
ncbi:hypothetical protein XI07_15290 [Bradyrhizobium sp. CCBAU 11445]|nr:hypothetical protein [Bradyrhizobium sp. CCBAU 11445]